MPIMIQFPMAQPTEQSGAVARQEHPEQVVGWLLGTAVAANTVVEAGWQSLGCRADTLALAELALRALVVVRPLRVLRAPAGSCRPWPCS